MVLGITRFSVGVQASSHFRWPSYTQSAGQVDLAIGQAIIVASAQRDIHFPSRALYARPCMQACCTARTVADRDFRMRQAFQGELLEACGRSHTLGDVEDALAAVAAAAPPSWSLDLISGATRIAPLDCSLVHTAHHGTWCRTGPCRPAVTCQCAPVLQACQG
jgi:hypothetical protein